jgi:hypothetical protein
MLSEEQAEVIRNKHLTPAQRLAKEKRDADAKRKRLERAREREEKKLAEITSARTCGNEIAKPSRRAS